MRFLSICGAALIFGAFAASLSAQGAGDSGPSLIYRSEPEYSAEATRARVQASVTLSVIVGEDGLAHDVRVTHGAGFGLDEKAIEAMGKWRFNPATRDGHPAPVPANIEMNFSILAKNDKIDHSGQRARLNFRVPMTGSRPELIVGQLPGNPATPGDQLLRFHLRVDIDGIPKEVTSLSSTDPVWEKQVLRVVQTWRFQPALVEGRPVAAEGDFEIEHIASEDSPILVEPPVNVSTDSDDPPRAPVPHTAPPALTIAGLTARGHHTATVLPNGTVLLAGGSDGSHAIASAQIFDWATRHIVNTGSLNEARSNHTATLLRDGTVLIAGGRAAGPIASAEIFDPSTGKFAPVGNLHEARESQVAIALADGRVLICGGTGAGNKSLASAEIYNPRTKTFTTSGAMTAPRSSFHALALNNGRILLLDSTADIYNPGSGDFRPAGKMETARSGFTATLLPNGKVLIAGDGAPTELYDPAVTTFTPIGQPLEFQQALLLNNGKVLLTASSGSTEIYDAAGGTFAPGPTIAPPGAGHAATVLQDGGVLITGAVAELLTIN